MTERLRLHRAALWLLLALAAAGELLWLFDAIRIGGSWYWIDAVDYIVYALALPPLLWLWYYSARLRLQLASGARGWRRAAVTAHSAALLLAAVAAVALLAAGRFAAAAVPLALAALLCFADIVARSRLGALAELAAILLLFTPTPYMVTYPGLTLNMNTYARVDGGAPAGEISGVLIFERPAFALDLLMSVWSPYYELDKRSVSDPPLTDQLQVVRVMKAGADQLAAAIALEKAGLGQGVVRLGARIAAVVEQAPASGVLKPGDVVVAAGGEAVRRLDDLVRAVSRITPGEQLPLTVRRDGQELELAVGTMAAPEDAGKARLGVHLSDEIELDIPRSVSFRPHLLHEGGPSHGAMLTLALLDQLTAGGVTHGNRVAGTGTIQSDGSVGPIGGIGQKTFSVARTGADVFFVPASQHAEAEAALRSGTNSMPIVPVGHIDDVLQWLSAHPK